MYQTIKRHDMSHQQANLLNELADVRYDIHHTKDFDLIEEDLADKLVFFGQQNPDCVHIEQDGSHWWIGTSKSSAVIKAEISRILSLPIIDSLEE